MSEGRGFGDRCEDREAIARVAKRRERVRRTGPQAGAAGAAADHSSLMFAVKRGGAVERPRDGKAVGEKGFGCAELGADARDNG